MISTTNLSMRYGAKILFKEVGLQFNTGHRYGLVGANGSGKSTLIKILTGELTSETGRVNAPTRCTIGSLKQDHFIYEQVPILDVVLMGKTRLWEALQKKNDLLKKEAFSDEECLELAELEHIIDEEEGYLASSEAAKL
jgi:ATPase subunit of ABC transporter with duplicated ATPase domains